MTADQIDGRKPALDAGFALEQVVEHNEAVLAVDALHIGQDQVFLLDAVFIDIGKAHNVFAPYAFGACMDASTVDRRRLPFSKSLTASMIWS